MKIYLLFIIILVAVSCNQQTHSNAESADSTAVTTDTIVSEPQQEVAQSDEQPQPDEPPISSSELTGVEFSFSEQTVSTDSRETEIADKLAQLVEQYKKEKYAIIKMSYSYDDAVGMGRVYEDEIWYYNTNRQLAAFSSTFKSARTSMSSFYLCNDGELVALSSDNEFQDEGPRAYTSVRIVSSLCPLCGLTLSKEEEDDYQEYQADLIEQSALDQYTRDFFNKHEEMLNTFRKVTNLTNIDEKYFTFILVNADTIKYTVDASLANEFFSKVLSQK